MKNNKGFTLVEVMIVLIILGLVMGAAFHLMRLYQQRAIMMEFKQDMSEIDVALAAYVAGSDGVLPCPAALNAAPGTAAHGAAGNCTDMSTALGACSGNAYCVLRGRGPIGNPAVDARDGNAANMLRVRIGAVPFRALRLSSETALDPYGNRYLYAVTEYMADDTNPDFAYNPAGGALEVETAAGVSLIADPGAVPPIPAGSGALIVYSTGPNSFGAFGRAGAKMAGCPGGQDETPNCRALPGEPGAKQAQFVQEGFGDIGFDDRLKFSFPGLMLWSANEEAGPGGWLYGR
jgi:prepilin-type N-terminal cleavage/methylation domain-containing protein